MKKNKSGFTLAELLVAVALIGILTAVSVVIFTGHIAESKETVCRNEKATMKHGTVIVSMTEHIDWKAAYGSGGLNSSGSEQIISYLLNEGYIEEFKCQSGGTIYAASVEKDMVEFKCTYHDDGMEPGEEGESNKAAKDLADAVNKYINEKSYGNSVTNDQIVKEFLDTSDSKFIVTRNTSSILTDSIIDSISKKMLELGKISESNVDVFIESLRKYREKDQYLVPYVSQSAKENKVITYYTSKEQYDSIFKTEGKKHSTTSLICYNGRWYFNTNLNGLNNAPNPSTILTRFTSCNNIQQKIDELIEKGLLIAI